MTGKSKAKKRTKRSISKKATVNTNKNTNVNIIHIHEPKKKRRVNKNTQPSKQPQKSLAPSIVPYPYPIYSTMYSGMNPQPPNFGNIPIQSAIHPVHQETYRTNNLAPIHATVQSVPRATTPIQNDQMDYNDYPSISQQSPSYESDNDFVVNASNSNYGTTPLINTNADSNKLFGTSGDILYNLQPYSTTTLNTQQSKKEELRRKLEHLKESAKKLTTPDYLFGSEHEHIPGEKAEEKPKNEPPLLKASDVTEEDIHRWIEKANEPEILAETKEEHEPVHDSDLELAKRLRRLYDKYNANPDEKLKNRVKGDIYSVADLTEFNDVYHKLGFKRLNITQMPYRKTTYQTLLDILTSKEVTDKMKQIDPNLHSYMIGKK
jgi:hypothetical protein